MAHSENLRQAIELTKEINELIATRAEIKAGLAITELVIGPKQLENMLAEHPLGHEISAEIAARRVAIAELI
jgi:hypothetical protein